MSAKNKRKRVGVVYSTDPDFVYAYEDDPQPAEALEPRQQVLRVQLDRKKRKGKEVTLVSGFVGPAEALGDLAKFLKKKCSVGGAVKDGQIVIQGDQRDQIVQLLRAAGYANTKVSG